MREPTDEQREALAHLVAQGGSFDVMRMVPPPLDSADLMKCRCYGTPVLQLFERGLVMFTGQHRDTITVTTMGRALAREWKP